MTTSLSDLDEMVSTLEQLTDHFYERARTYRVFQEMFRGMAGEGREAVADFIAEVFGGWIEDADARDRHAHLIARHIGRFFTLPQRRLWMDLLLECADALGLSDDRESRLALVEYLEWGSRAALQQPAHRHVMVC